MATASNPWLSSVYVFARNSGPTGPKSGTTRSSSVLSVSRRDDGRRFGAGRTRDERRRRTEIGRGIGGLRIGAQRRDQSGRRTVRGRGWSWGRMASQRDDEHI